MNGAYLLRQLFTGMWFIDPQHALIAGPIVQHILSGEEIPKLGYKDGEDNPYRPFAYSPAEPGYYSGFTNAQPGSIAVIPVVDVLMKYDQECGPVGTQTISKWLQQAEQNVNIDAIVLKIDSPGGTVDGTQTLAQQIAACKKPVVAFVDGMMCSAAYWIGSAADYIICSTSTDIIGSIGTMMSWADAQPMWEKEGVVFHNVYADKSKDKNKIFTQANQKNYKPLKEKFLNPTNDVFVAAVQENRKGKLQADAAGVLSGEVFMAEFSVALGLTDAIGTIEDAFKRAGAMADESKNKNSGTMKLTVGKTLATFFSKLGFATAETDEVTAEHVTQMEKVATENIALTDRLAKNELDFATAQSALAETESALKAEQDAAAKAAEKLTALEAQVKDLEAKVVKFGAQDGAGAVETGKEKDKIASASKAGFELDMTMEHNKHLAEVIGSE